MNQSTNQATFRLNNKIEFEVSLVRAGLKIAELAREAGVERKKIYQMMEGEWIDIETLGKLLGVMEPRIQARREEEERAAASA